MIPKSALVHGAYYRGRCRNASVARWDATLGAFVYRREKWGHAFDETILHPEDVSRFDVFTPEELINGE